MRSSLAHRAKGDITLVTALHLQRGDGANRGTGIGNKASLIIHNLQKLWCGSRMAKGAKKRRQKRRRNTPPALPRLGLNLRIAGPRVKDTARARGKRPKVCMSWAKKMSKNFNNFAVKRKFRSSEKRFWLAYPACPAKMCNQQNRTVRLGTPLWKLCLPKPKKVVLAQSRILGQDSVSKRLLTDEVVSWMDVKAQLSGQSAQDIKSLCKQICEHAPRNKSDCITKIMDQLQSLD